VGCQLNSDQALRLLCLKGHDRARGSKCDIDKKTTEFERVLCPVDVVCKSSFANHRSESSFFNQLNLGHPRVRLFAPLLEMCL